MDPIASHVLNVDEVEEVLHTSGDHWGGFDKVLTLRCGQEEAAWGSLIYLAIGVHDPHEVCVYPDSGKVMVRSLRRVGFFEKAEYLAGELERPKVFDLAAKHLGTTHPKKQRRSGRGLIPRLPIAPPRIRALCHIQRHTDQRALEPLPLPLPQPPHPFPRRAGAAASPHHPQFPAF